MRRHVICAFSILALASACPPAESGIPDDGTATADESTTTTEASSASATVTATTSTTGDADPTTTGEPELTTTGATDSDPSTSTSTTLPEPTCGDGNLDIGEECDEGDENDDVGACTETCTLPKCGDGHIQGDEECDLGVENDNEGECTNVCALPYCGDGFVQSGEACDLGDANDANGTCHPETCEVLTTCGDGILQDYEECDKSAGGDLASACTDQCLVTRKIIFASSVVYSGEFKAIQLADHQCQVLAKAAGLANDGAFIAWLSAPGQPVASRLSDDMYKYARVDGMLVADNPVDLLDGQLKVPIGVDELGGDATLISGFAWTGTLPDGEVAAETCLGWSSGSPGEKGIAGSLSSPGAAWTKSMGNPCSYKLHLYCVET